MSGITLVCGYPNSGKTTLSEQFEHVIHLDDFPPSKFLNCNQAVAKAEGDVVVEGIYNLKCRRIKLLETCKDKKPKICYFLDTPYEVCVQRESQGRQRQGVMEHSHIEIPTYEEGWDEIIILRQKK